MNEPDRGLRSLEAIHLATARLLAPELNALVTYDERQIKAAADAGLATASPGLTQPEVRQVPLALAVSFKP
jgi:hypothetical protein